MTQYAIAQIARAVERIDQRAVLVFGDGVDGQIAAAQIVFERHARFGVEGETVIAAPGFAFGARQRIFLARLRMQEHREILAHRFEVQREELLRRGADDHVVAILHGNAEQTIAHRAADQIGLHARIMRSGARNFTPRVHRRR